MSDRRERIVAARLRLRERWLDRMADSPGVADAAPRGSGPTNRHGMPRLPVGQSAVDKWPVLDLGIRPRVPTARWGLAVDGESARAPTTLSWDDLMGLEQVEQEVDFHCVTTWSRMDLRLTGVRLADVIALADPADDASHVLTHAHDGYTTNLPLQEALKDDVMVVHSWDGAPLPREHGGPARVVTPQLYAWKGAKWVSRIELLPRDVKGFWELRGYSNTAHPWGDDRYSS